MSEQQRQEHVATRLAGHPVFRDVPAAAIAALVSDATLHYLNAGEALYEANSRADTIFVVLEGCLQIEYPKPGETRGVVTAMLGAPSVLGECQVLHDRPWSGTGVALVPLLAVGIGAALLERTMMQHPVLGIALYREVTLRFLNAIDAWKAAPVRSVEEQLARYMAGAMEALASDSALPFSQAVLGRATGLRRETINRILARWETDGILEAGARGIRRIDRRRLETVAGSAGVALVQRLDTRSASERTLGGQ